MKSYGAGFFPLRQFSGEILRNAFRNAGKPAEGVIPRSGSAEILRQDKAFRGYRGWKPYTGKGRHLHGNRFAETALRSVFNLKPVILPGLQASEREAAVAVRGHCAANGQAPHRRGAGGVAIKKEGPFLS